MGANSFVARGSNLTKLSHVTCREAGMTIWVQHLGCRILKIWQGKNSPKVSAISDYFRI